MLPGTKQDIKLELSDAKPHARQLASTSLQHRLPYRFTESIKLPEYRSQIWIQNSKMWRLIAFLPDTCSSWERGKFICCRKLRNTEGYGEEKLEVSQSLSFLSRCCDKISQQKNLKGERVYLANNSMLQYSPPLWDSRPSRNWKQMSDVILSEQQRVMNSCRLLFSFPSPFYSFQSPAHGMMPSTFRVRH